jgi:hypothetical protein
MAEITARCASFHVIDQDRRPSHKVGSNLVLFRFAGTNGRNETTGQVQIICKDRHVGRGACDADADACERRANARRTCDGAFG